MTLNFNEKELNRAVNDFFYATGINIVLLDADMKALTKNALPDNFCHCLQKTKEGKENCWNSDLQLIKKCSKSHKTEQHICHAGLVDTVVPLIDGERIIGYILIGQMRTHNDFEDIYKNVSNLNINKNHLKEKYEKLPYCDTERLESLINIAVMLTEYILFKNLLKPRYNTMLETATEYIKNNISREISINEICDVTNTSKNILYKIFRENLNCTIGEYINILKIEKAKNLLNEAKYNTQEIAEMVGIFNYTYFCKLFKKITGVTPKKFKKPQN